MNKTSAENSQRPSEEVCDCRQTPTQGTPARSELDPPEFLALLNAARSGSSEALGQLLDQVRQYLWLVARREIGLGLQGKVAPSDLVQETFVHAHEKIQQFRGSTQAELVAWFCRILLTRLARERRRYQGTKRRNVLRELSLTSGDVDLQEVVTSLSDTSPGTTLVRGELRHIVAREIERLPDDYRRVINLRNLERKSFREIGQEMGRSAEAVRKLWARAIDQLSGALERLDENT